MDETKKCYNGIVKTKRQHIIGTYRIDLYFPDYKIVVECDEFNHNDRDPTYEKEREDYLRSLGNHIVRYNPNDTEFDLSFVINEINYYLLREN